MTYAAPTIVAGSNGQAAADAINVTRPIAVRIGDLLLLVIATEKDGTGITPPDGWTAAVAELTENGAVNLAVFWRFATHAEPSLYTVTLDAADDAIWNLSLVRGVDPWAVVHVSTSAQGAGAFPVAEPGVITTIANTLAVAVLAYDGSPRAIVQPAGWTLLDSDDGPLHTISWAIAYKTMAAAGPSGGANWTAADGSADDYIALTFAITPGVMGRSHSILYSPQQLLAKTLADCSEFRNLVGAADHATAFARIWHESLPPPAAGARKYSLAELEAYRPYALVFTRDPDGVGTTREGSPNGPWSDSGSLWIRLVLDVPDGMDADPVVLDHLVKQLVGRIMRCPPDETFATFKGLMDLSGLTNETGGYSYLAADRVLFKSWTLATEADDPEQGAFVVATLEVQWGGAA